MSEHRRVRTKIMRAFRADLEEKMKQARLTLDKSLENTFGHEDRPCDSNCRSIQPGLIHLQAPILGFNGQIMKASLLFEVMRQLDCDVFVETGTFRGETSLLVAAHTALPVFTCELNELAYRFASATLAPLGTRVQVTLQDSRSFLHSFIATSQYRRPFFYLDAHWNDDIPLRREIELIVSQLFEFVIVIDDFKVPFDSQFKYDTYGSTSFEESYIMPILQPYAERICLLYPAYPCNLETGAKRGFCIIAARSAQDRILETGHNALRLAPSCSRTG